MPNLPTYELKPEPPEHKPVISFGIKVDPVASLRNCEVGKCFIVDRDADRKRLLIFARRMSITIRTAKTSDGRYEIWRRS